jgi:hypothetical protein
VVNKLLFFYYLFIYLPGFTDKSELFQLGQRPEDGQKVCRGQGPQLGGRID